MAKGVPDRFLQAPCNWWNSKRTGVNGFALQGNYCARPPVDSREFSFALFLSEDLTVVRRNNEEFVCELRLRLPDLPESVYILKDSTNLKLNNMFQNVSEYILSGQYSAILHNRRDPTDSIRLIDGRFDMRY